jgi:hypothetical protein
MLLIKLHSFLSQKFRQQRPELWWSQGCSKALHQLLIQKLHVVGIVAIVIAFFQVRMILFFDILS